MNDFLLKHRIFIGVTTPSAVNLPPDGTGVLALEDGSDFLEEVGTHLKLEGNA